MVKSTVGRAIMSESRLRSEVVPVRSLAPSDITGLFDLFAGHYDRVDRARFEADLAEKDFVIMLRDAQSGQARGFSTQKVLRTNIQGQEVRAIFSGDTIIDPAYWGEQELVRSWCSFAGRIRSEEPETRLFWFLIVKGYRTYLYLPVFFHDYYPRYDAPTPLFEQQVMHRLGLEKFPDHYSPDSGLIEFQQSLGQLTAELAEVPPARQADPRVMHFLSLNPGYPRGVELVCLTEVRPENMKSIALRMMLEGEKLGPLTCLTS